MLRGNNWNCCGRLSSSCQFSKELKIRKLISIQAEFISNTFSGKRKGLGKVGKRGIGFGSLCPEVSLSLGLFVPVPPGGVRKLHIHLTGKVMHSYFLSVGMGGGLLTQILTCSRQPLVILVLK